MKILIIDGNSEENNQQAIAQGALPYYQAYGDVLKGLQKDIEIDHAHPVVNGVECIKKGKHLSDYDGFAWTGSPLNLYDGGIEIDRQRQFGERLLTLGKPIFGSCWGLQINAELLGGKVVKNPKGREVGVSRTILVNEIGQNHALYWGKQSGFDAFGVHSDIVALAPEGAEILAFNEMSAIQAMSYQKNGVDFWGVQYHPEFDFTIMARILRRLRDDLAQEGLFESPEHVDNMAFDYEQMAENPEQPAIIQRQGLTQTIIDQAIHRQELKNWLGHVAKQCG